MAQLVEQRPYKAKVGSSSLSGSTVGSRTVEGSGAALLLGLRHLDPLSDRDRWVVSDVRHDATGRTHRRTA